MTAYDLHWDAKTTAETGAIRQRYATAGDAFVMLSRVADRYEMRNAMTGAAHTLDVASTDVARLAAHWQGFCRANGVDR